MTKKRPSEIRAEHPHCDSDVLHAPGECVYCDHFADRQRAREEQGVNFTGHYDAGKVSCPSELRRPIEKINRWPGNVATTAEMQAERDKEFNEMIARVKPDVPWWETQD